MKIMCYALMAVLLSVSLGAQAKVTHVSINQQLFELGHSPKLRVNIVSKATKLDKLQFIVEQSTGSERLMVQPMNSYLLLLSGVEDVSDSAAQLVIKEYQVNQWHEVKRIALFQDGVSLSAGKSRPQQSQGVVKPKRLPPQQAHTVSSSVVLKNRTEARAERVQANCQLERQPQQTLWRIASQYAKAWGLNTYGAILAIYEANPKAFTRGKINGLRADVPLYCPSEQVKLAYKDGRAAKQTFESLVSK